MKKYLLGLILIVITAAAGACEYEHVGRVWFGLQTHEGNGSTAFGPELGTAGIEIDLVRYRSIDLVALFEHTSTIGQPDPDGGLETAGIRLYINF